MAHDGVTRQLGGTSLGSNIAPPLLCDLNNTLPVSGPGSLVREARQLPALHQESRASQPRYSGARQPLKSHIHGDSKRAPLSPSPATQHPQPTWTEHMAPASPSPLHAQAPRWALHLLSQLTPTSCRRKLRLGLREELPQPRSRKQRPLRCPPGPSPPWGLSRQNRAHSKHQPRVPTRSGPRRQSPPLKAQTAHTSSGQTDTQR